MALFSHALAQNNENNFWYFGNNAGLNFNNYPPTPLTNGAMNVAEGCASVSDGGLLFYTDGMTVYNRLHVPMANGTGLQGYFSSSQAAIVVKRPGSTGLYFIFTQGANFDGLRYSVVDMSLSGGVGAVTTKNVLLSALCSEKLVAVKHCNGTDTWVVTHDNTGNIFKSYLVSASGINTTPVVSAVGAVYVSGNDIGCIKASPNGRKLVAALFGPSPGYELFDFDNTTGVLSNSFFMPGFFSAYGVAFSGDGTKLYGTRLSGVDVYQWDMCAGSPAAIIASKYNVCTTGQDKGQIQLASDGKIYIARPFQQFLGVIGNPNASGAACGFVEAGQSIAPGTSNFGLPNFINVVAAPPLQPFTYTVNGCQNVGFRAPASVQGFPASSCRSTGAAISSIQWIFGEPSSGAANTSAQVNPTHAYTSLGTYTVKLALGYSCGGTDTITQQVVVNKLCLIVNSAISCASLGSATVSTSNGIGPFSYTWMPTAQTGSVATGLSPGTYSISVFDAGSNTSSTSTINLASPTSYTGNVNHSNITCNGLTNGSATVTSITGGSGNQTYAWSNGGSINASPMPNNLTLGTWSVTVTDALTGCNFTTSFLITEPPATTLNITASPSVSCIGGNIELTGINSGGTPLPGGGYHYIFSGAGAPSNGTYTPGSVPGIFNVSESIAGTYVYSLSSSDANNCSSRSTISVKFINRPVLAVSDVSVCPRQTATLQVSGADSYTWSNNATGSTFTDNPSANQQYTVTGSVDGCTATATASVTLKPAPVPTLTSNSPVCEGEMLQMSANAGANYSWSGPQGFTADVQSPVVMQATPANSGVYQFLASVNGCTTGISKTLTVLPAPAASFDYFPARPVENLDPVTFRASLGDDISSFKWLIKDNDSTYTSFSQGVSHLYQQAGTYPVALVVENNIGCRATFVATLEIASDFDIYIPSAFTPNNDDLNESFQPVARGVKQYVFTIVDRWGTTVFSTSDPGAGWDGSFRGAACKQDVYSWHIKVAGANGKIKELTGQVALLKGGGTN